MNHKFFAPTKINYNVRVHVHVPLCVLHARRDQPRRLLLIRSTSRSTKAQTEFKRLADVLVLHRLTFSHFAQGTGILVPRPHPATYSREKRFLVNNNMLKKAGWGLGSRLRYRYVCFYVPVTIWYGSQCHGHEI